MPASPGSHNPEDADSAADRAQPLEKSPQKIEERFRDAATILRRALASWRSMTNLTPAQVGGASSQLDRLRDLRAAFAEIARMCEFTRHLADDGPAGYKGAAADYRDSLAQFRLQLPRIQGWLMVERSRLAGRHSHSTSVSEWIDANRQTR